ncbi:hypothetical protein Tco_1255216 [Tanacetum coccineum]
MDTAIRTSWIRRIRHIGYGVPDLLGTAYRAPPVRCIGVLGYGVLYIMGTAYWLFGYEELAENVLLMVFDQSIIYGVSAGVDTAYSSKSGNGLESFKVIRYGFLQPFLIFTLKHFKLPEDVVNRILQVVLDLQHFKSSPCVLTPMRGESLKNLNGFDVHLPVSH